MGAKTRGDKRGDKILLSAQWVEIVILGAYNPRALHEKILFNSLCTGLHGMGFSPAWTSQLQGSVPKTKPNSPRPSTARKIKNPPNLLT